MQYQNVSIGMMIRKISKLGFELYMQIREDDGIYHGYLEFPGGGIEAGETPDQALVREFQEEVGIDISNTSRKLFKIHPQVFTDKDKQINLFTFIIRNDAFKLDERNWKTITFEGKSTEYKGKIPHANEDIIDQFSMHLQEAVEHNLEEYLWMS